MAKCYGMSTTGLEAPTARDLTRFSQSGKLLDVAKSPGSQVGAEGAKAACGPKCEGGLEEVSRYNSLRVPVT